VWRNYMLLETFDYLSLLTCFGFESAELADRCRRSRGGGQQLSVRRLSPEVEVTHSHFQATGWRSRFSAFTSRAHARVG